jgi:tetratricopeptide (TPR) repeat protein
MKQCLLIAVAFILSAGATLAQTVPASPTPTPKAISPVRQGATFELSEYGVEFQADPRLIVVMAALEAAGFQPLPPGREPSAFRSKLRKDLTDLDPDLRSRLRTFYERNLLPAPATAADQASRYVTLALALTPPPELEPPTRSDDLPPGLLEVLDFAPLVREFYRRSGIDSNLTTYVRDYQLEGDRLREPTTALVRSILTYLHTRPMTSIVERVEVKSPSSKKPSKTKTYSSRQKERRFLILPDRLAARGTINFRVIGDDYFAIVPEGTDPASSELRRAYLQYVIDPLVLRFNKDVALRRDQIRQLLDERQKSGTQVSPDAFLSVTRSLVAAADARYDELQKREALARATRSRLLAAKDDASRTAITKAGLAEINAIQDETVARLAEEYEKGAVLSFFFADQLKGIESAGFDIANFFPDMIASFDPARELRRPAEYAEVRKRAVAAREARLAARRAESEMNASADANPTRDAVLVRELAAVEDTLRIKDYNEAEARLKAMLKDYPREPRVFFALGQTASMAASDATDEKVQAERLNRALAHYRLAIEASSPETDKAVLSRAHESMGRINAFLDNNAEAAKEFDEAIKIGDVRGGAYKEALEGKKKLLP